MTLLTTRPGEIGLLAAGAIRSALVKATDQANISSYIEGQSPLAWSDISDAGWDLVGVTEDDESATLRDLVEIAKAWGEITVQLPLLTTIMAKRHSASAAEHDGPVTFSIPTRALSAGTGMVPFGQIADMHVVSDFISETSSLVAVQSLASDIFAPSLRAAHSSHITTFTAEAAREISVVWAAEGSGIAKRAVADAVTYAKQRMQFGKPIGSFQAVKHHLSNAHMDAEQAETAVVWGSLDPANAHRSAVYSLDLSIRAVELAIQVHGGIGFTWEMGLHFYLRHLITLREMVTALGEHA
ncbi:MULTISPECIES: acyl-CoA dehydrogenase family protein [Cryobacterium]|uniref:Acyl-CoA dehydrogenase n=1 Tax=Cryobacterium levicorallinum TaxID=995038 RepID=A0A1I2XYF8_9MICO|nr:MULTISPECIES: acyl-CoA dehydrogenase family protein [Cryobacterium]TFB85067.1 acyl-CoA dehydrogenase [Cryobacterium levicorallinum]TFD62436.1 acyl-CoA dehydrogenase [Cryobacterium sp. Hh38]GEP26277.1 hypothetical protein CLE01_08750 [Cryobacterium levicorallinum]SFH18504.1 Acyl-CoA dehydrogenase, C-terminal domain [Cryobacterium levicorallinum]